MLLFSLSIQLSLSLITKDILYNSYKELIKFYNTDVGLFNDYGHYWTSANSIETLCNYYDIIKNDNDSNSLILMNEINNMIENTYSKLKLTFHNFFRSRDDYYWWVLAFIRTYEVTGDDKYVRLSDDIFRTMISWGEWNSTCYGGGVMWSADSKYINAITNELFMNAATKLYDIYHSDYYNEWADLEVLWFLNQSKLITSNGIILDGLPTSNCSMDALPVGDYWTYNSGVLLDALCRRNNTNLALNITNSAIKYYSRDNVMLELSCSPDGQCDGLDGKMFKGSFVRHLYYAYQFFPDSDNKNRIKEWLLYQAESIIKNASLEVEGGLLLGQQWQGPVPGNNDSDQMVSQSSAFDSLLAAYQLQK